MRHHQRLRILLIAVLLAFGPVLHAIAADDNASNGEEPSKPTCRLIPKNSLEFCSMVNYVAVVDQDDLDGAKFDAKAKFYYENVDVVLQRFGCHARYSLYKCDDCREAYKYWICSIKFQKCGRRPDEQQFEPGICTTSSSTTTSAATAPGTCESGVSGRHRTCLSLCEDVVRKCPYVLNFQCPTVRASLLFALHIGKVSTLRS